ncbi:uncharacterized protein BDZ99DRAFT_526168 [Mytilinidion resinicola]|uniref:NHL repeat-containing protein n=1 Tax=Mytilinidion resinicola TaxID=574789 RepID=A0A6A6Y657_9PEZI|nr:uncharacterized protein BDZ99DRAFT_526168 [Mytilinidion resinicola]KAF2803685.1 hypothetical protein BDZ99DRAFT_526168 [Mytilinidion resinicola]
MKLFCALIGALCISGAHSLPVSGSPDPLNPNIQTLHQFPKGAWVENLAVRQNGALLVTRLDVPELWQIDPVFDPINSTPLHPSGNARLIYRFPGATGLMGIAGVNANSSDHDRYAVTAVNFSLMTFTAIPSSSSVWLVDLTSEKNDVHVEKIADIPEAGVLSDITNLDILGNMLISDSTAGCIWKLNVNTKEYGRFLCDDTMKPLPAAGLPVGLNGMKTLTNVAIDRASGATRSVFNQLAAKLTVDNFAVDYAGNIWAAGNPTNTVTVIGKDNKVVWTIGSKNSSALAGITALAWRSRTDGPLYGTTCGGVIAPVNGTFTEGGKVVAIQIWGLAGVN